MTARKRSSGEGSIQKLKSGTWRGQIMDGYTDLGKRNVVSFSAPTKSEVLDKIRAFKNDQANHIQIDPALTFGEWADTWYTDYRSQVQPSTYDGYKYTLKLLKNALGTNKLADLLPIHINRFQDRLVNDGYSLSQIHKCRAMLIQIFRSAEDNGLLGRNPAQRSKIITAKDSKLSSPKRFKDAFTEEEVNLLMEQLPSDLMGNSIRVMLGTGLRVQEIIALKPEDIATDGGKIIVSKAVKMVGGLPTMGPPKSPKSNRTVPVPKEYCAFARYLRGNGGKQYIWSAPGLNPVYSVGSFRRRYYTAIEKVDGVRRLSPHCCRHTYISRLQARGIPMETISKLAGHTEIDTTCGYLHLSDATLASAVEVLNHTRH